MSVSRPGHVARDAWQLRSARPKRLTADDVMTARDVARLLHAPVSTVEDWARQGHLAQCQDRQAQALHTPNYRSEADWSG